MFEVTWITVIRAASLESLREFDEVIQRSTVSGFSN